MEFKAIIKTALKVMISNKMRTSLAVLGIVIGIASVIVVFSAGEGIRSLVVGQVESFGTNIIETEVKVPKKSAKGGSSSDMESGMAIAQGVQVTTLTLSDMADINKLPNVIDSYAAIMSQEQVSYGNELRKSYLSGVSASFIDIDKSEIAEGRFFSDVEDKSLSEVVVLGSKMKKKLFGDSDPIGKKIKIKKTKFRVIGVMKERGAAGFIDFDDFVYVPIGTLQKKMMGIDYVLYMIHEIRDLSVANQTADDIRTILRNNHDISDPDKDDFNVVTMEEMMKVLGTVTNAITLLLLAIVTVSLVVGGVGILNVMYVAVSERTPEIGLRKAVGANYRDIMLQFLIEAVLISLAGGIIGIFLGILLSFLISWGAGNFGLSWEFSAPLKGFVVALSFSAVFGVAFGVYPARQAARLDPVAALRKE